MPTHTRLKGVTDVNDALLNDQLETNIAEFLSWGTLNIGGFTNININSSGVFGGNFSQLRPSQIKGYTNGKVWQGFRENWVWESGLEYTPAPISISGIFVNSAFLPYESGYIIDYPRGRIIFTNPIAITSEVKLAYSFKHINFFTTNDIPWFKEAQLESYRVDDTHFGLVGSGSWAIYAENRLQLPSVIVECVPSRGFKGYQIGGGQTIFQEVHLHVLAETPQDKKNILDILSYQNEKSIFLFDKNAVKDADKFPINYNGSRRTNAMNYERLVAHYTWREATFSNTKVLHSQSTTAVYSGIVKTTMEVVMPEL